MENVLHSLDYTRYELVELGFAVNANHSLEYYYYVVVVEARLCGVCPSFHSEINSYFS